MTEAEQALARVAGDLNAYPDNHSVCLETEDARLLLSLARQAGALEAALERIADPRNIHFAGDAQVVARAALQSRSEK